MRSLSAAAALLACGGIARTAVLHRRGVSERELARAVGAGEIIRIRKGVFALAEVSPILRGAAERGGVPGCTDAGRLIGLWILTETPGHVWVGATGTVHGDDQGVRIAGGSFHDHVLASPKALIPGLAAHLGEVAWRLAARRTDFLAGGAVTVQGGNGVQPGDQGRQARLAVEADRLRREGL